MPVIVNSQEKHPFLPSLGNPTAISNARAEVQDIRPLDIAIINLMADKQATERQLANWLGKTMLQVQITFAATDQYVRDVQAGRETKNTPSDHIKKFYQPWGAIKDKKFDGLIITGVNALKNRVSEEEIWPEVQKILDWSQTHTQSSLFLCWGAKAALKHFHNIESHKGEQKLFGLFEHEIKSDKTNILAGLPDRFSIPVSRWKSPRREDIAKTPALEIVADSPEAGPNIMAESAPSKFDDTHYPRRLYILNHPEYDTDTLGNEYARDSKINPATPLPRHYFQDNDPSKPPYNSWRHTAYIYTRWIEMVYNATPYNKEEIGESS